MTIESNFFSYNWIKEYDVESKDLLILKEVGNLLLRRVKHRRFRCEFIGNLFSLEKMSREKKGPT